MDTNLSVARKEDGVARNRQESLDPGAKMGSATAPVAVPGATPGTPNVVCTRVAERSSRDRHALHVRCVRRAGGHCHRSPVRRLPLFASSASAVALPDALRAFIARLSALLVNHWGSAFSY